MLQRFRVSLAKMFHRFFSRTSHTYMDRLSDPFFVLDQQDCFAYMNHAAEAFLGRKRGDLLGKKIWDQFREAEQYSFYKHAQSAIRNRTSVEFHEYIPALRIWFDVRIYPAGEGVAVQFRDITKDKMALVASQEYYTSLFEHHPDPVFTLDLAGNVLSANHSCEKVFGYSLEKLLTMNYAAFVPVGELDRTKQKFQETTSGTPQCFEIKAIVKEEKLRSFLVTAIPIILHEEVVGIYGIASDITERKQAEEKLREREASLELAQRIARIGSWEWGIDEQYITCSEQLLELFGSDEQAYTKLRYQDFLACIHPQDMKQFEEAVHCSLRGKPLKVEFRIVNSRGQLRYVEAVGEPYFDKSGNPVKLIGTAMDVTDRVFEQEQLRKSEEKFQLVLNYSQDIICYTCPKGMIEYISPSAKKTLGYEPELLIGMRASEFFKFNDSTRYPHSKGDSVIFTGRVQHKDGHYIWLEIFYTSIMNSEGEIEKILAIGRDISDRIAATEMIKRSEKLNMAGQLAAGIAHEIRNPLTAVKGFFHMMKSGRELKQEYYEVIHAELSRIEVIVDELLLLAKPQGMNFGLKDIQFTIQQVATLLSTEAALRDIELIMCMTPGQWVVNCDENQLKQVFINLMKNAMDAMPNGGELRIEAARDGMHVQIRFIDQGCGIPPDLLTKIGQPFYTTKDKGTGLGLAVSYNIIEHHQGEIKVESREGQGTTFIVTLPLQPSDNEQQFESVG